jgi:hypothetical protein
MNDHYHLSTLRVRYQARPLEVDDCCQADGGGQQRPVRIELFNRDVSCGQSTLRNSPLDPRE